MFKNLDSTITILNEKNLPDLCDCDPSQTSIITVSGENVTKIDANAFANLTSVQELNLSNNQIKSMDDFAFANLFQLEKLSLNNNKLESLNASTFGNLTNVQNISLNSNQLKSIDSTTFQGLNSLQELDLSSNQLLEIHANTFTGLGSLQKLHLGNNISFTGITDSADKCSQDLEQFQNLRTELFTDFFKKTLLIVGSKQFISFSKNSFKSSEVCLHYSPIEIGLINNYSIFSICGVSSFCYEFISKSKTVLLLSLCFSLIRDFSFIFKLLILAIVEL